MKADNRGTYESKVQPDRQKTTKKSLMKDTKMKRGETEEQRKKGCPRQRAPQDSQFLKHSQPAEDAEVIISPISNSTLLY